MPKNTPSIGLLSDEGKNSKSERVTVMYWKGKSFPVTGGCGFIGSDFVKILVEKCAFVRVAGHLSRGRTENIFDVLDQFESMKADLTKEENCYNACKGINIIFHLVASAGDIECLNKASVGGCLQGILMNTHILETSVRYRVEHFLFTSSARLYHAYVEGRETQFHLKEEDAYPVLPQATYEMKAGLGA